MPYIIHDERYVISHESSGKRRERLRQSFQLASTLALAAVGPLLPCAGFTACALAEPMNVDVSGVMESATGQEEVLSAPPPNRKPVVSSFLERTQKLSSQDKAGNTASANGFGKQMPVKNFYQYFVDPRTLEAAIRSCGSDERFYDMFSPLYKNRAIAQLINGLPHTSHAIKARLSRVVQEHEGTLASDVELSDIGFDERRHRQETAVPTGKTGVFVILFKKILALIHGQDIIDEAMEAGRESRRILQRLRDQGVSDENLTPAQIQALVELRLTKSAPFSGIPFDPYASTLPTSGTFYMFMLRMVSSAFFFLQ